MATGVATTAGRIVVLMVISFMAGVAIVYYYAQPYLCDKKINRGKATYCYVNTK
jgi:hypothetical protein